MALEFAAGSATAGATCTYVDAARVHPWAFVFMGFLALAFGVARVAKETKIAVKSWRSFVHWWMAFYLALLGFLMALTTAVALILLVDPCGNSRVKHVVPDSFISAAAAVLGVFGFEFLVRKFMIGFGENRLDVGSTLQDLVDQSVAATLRKEAG
jgi:hypothetical protein